jgi:hypothetical protein
VCVCVCVCVCVYIYIYTHTHKHTHTHTGFHLSVASGPIGARERDRGGLVGGDLEVRVRVYGAHLSQGGRVVAV